MGHPGERRVYMGLRKLLSLCPCPRQDTHSHQQGGTAVTPVYRGGSRALDEEVCRGAQPRVWPGGGENAPTEFSPARSGAEATATLVWAGRELRDALGTTQGPR